MPLIDDQLDDIEGQLADAQEDTPPPSSEDSALETAPAAAPAVVPPNQTTGMTFNSPGSQPQPASVQNYIAQRLADQTDALKKAQAQANRNRLYAGVTEGLGQIGAGLSRQGNFNPQSYQYLHQQADAPVQNFLEQQKARGEAIGQIGAEQGAVRKVQMSDAGSLQSHVAQGIVASQLQKYFPDVDKSMVEGLSADDLHDFLEKPIDQAQAAQYKTEIAKLRLEQQKGRQVEASRAAQEKADQKAQHDRDQALTQTQQLLESARGNPAVAQAERDVYAANKVKALSSMYGDPNKLSPQMARLLQAEVGKIATGGTPSMHELEGLDAKPFVGKLAGIWQQFSNEPSAANAGAFLKQYQDYANGLSKDAKKVITDKYGRVIEPRRKVLGDDHYNSLKSLYLDRFNDAGSEGGKDSSEAAVAPSTDPGLEAEMKKRGLLK